MTTRSWLDTFTTFATVLVVLNLVCKVGAFPPSATVGRSSRHPTLKFFSSRSSDDDSVNSSGMGMDMDMSDSFYLERFQRRKQAWSELVERESQRRPPNPQLEPMEVVTELLQGLRDPDQPRLHFGIHVLLRSSTTKWAQTICQSIGAATSAVAAADSDSNPSKNATVRTSATTSSEEYARTVEAALHRSLARPGQQFAILMGVEDVDYTIDFPTDVLELDDDECWLECRLRGGGGGADKNDLLLVVLGWTLHKIDGTWRVHQMDWQDFRDAYRPGIGREEWERICG